MLTLTSIADFIIQTSIVAPGQSSLSPIHMVKLLSATFVCDFCVYHTLLYIFTDGFKGVGAKIAKAKYLI